MTITWADRVANLAKALGRKPTLDEMLDAAQIHEMKPAEVEAQQQSFVRGMRSAGFGLTQPQLIERIAEVTLQIAALKTGGAAYNALVEQRDELIARLCDSCQ